MIGDKILAVNNKKTDNLTHQEVVDLLLNAGQHVHLKIQYKIPSPGTTHRNKRYRMRAPIYFQVNK